MMRKKYFNNDDIFMIDFLVSYDYYGTIYE